MNLIKMKGTLEMILGFYWFRNKHIFFLIVFLIITANGLHGTCRYKFTKEFNNISIELDKNQKFTVPIDSKDIFKPIIIENAPANESTVIQKKNGTFKIFFVNRPGDANKMMSISSKDGITWNFPEKEFELPGQAYYANQVCVDRFGTLHCVFHIQGAGNNGYRGRHYDLWYCQKELNKKWTNPCKIFTGYVGSIRNFFQLESGRLLMTFGKANSENSEKPKNNEIDYGWNEIMALYSDDLGHSWTSSQNTLKIAIDSERKTRYGAIEPDVIQLKDGTLWMLIRTNKGVLYQSSSFNDGKNWSEPEPTKFISSDSPAKFLRLTDGRIIVFFNMNQRWDKPNSYAFGGREVLHAAISSDDGKTWKGFREVMRTPEKLTVEKGDRGTAYPSALETEEGKVLLVSGQGKSKFIVIFDPDYLVQDVIQKEDDWKSIDEWNIYGATETISKDFLKRDKNLIFLVGPKNKTIQKQEVVLNFPAANAGELKMKIEFVKDCSKLDFSFTDHFSVSNDSLASTKTIFGFTIGNSFLKKQKIPIKITWDIKNNYAKLYLFNNQISKQKIHRIPIFGVNYLRINISAKDDSIQSGFLIESMSIKKL